MECWLFTHSNILPGQERLDSCHAGLEIENQDLKSLEGKGIDNRQADNDTSATGFKRLRRIEPILMPLNPKSYEDSCWIASEQCSRVNPIINIWQLYWCFACRSADQIHLCSHSIFQKFSLIACCNYFGFMNWSVVASDHYLLWKYGSAILQVQSNWHTTTWQLTPWPGEHICWF